MPVPQAESLAVLLIILLLLIGAVLVVFLWGGAVFFQGYIYTEPAEQMYWRAPAAAGVLLLFFALWCFLEAKTNRAGAGDTTLVIPGFFSPYQDMTSEPVKRLWVERKGGKGPVEFVRRTYVQAGVKHYEYVEAKTDRRWNPSGVQAVFLEVDGEKDRFVMQKGPEGNYRQFVDSNGWTMAEYDTGPTGQPERFRLDWLLGNLLLNFLHLALWFVCLWLLLQFQWSHALGLAIALWLVASFTLLPILLTEARAIG